MHFDTFSSKKLKNKAVVMSEVLIVQPPDVVGANCDLHKSPLVTKKKVIAEVFTSTVLGVLFDVVLSYLSHEVDQIHGQRRAISQALQS